MIQKSAPIIAKKIAANAAKKQLAKETFRKNELKVDTYEKLVMNRPRAKKTANNYTKLQLLNKKCVIIAKVLKINYGNTKSTSSKKITFL